MKRIVTAIVLIPIVLVLVFKAPLWLFAAVTCVVALLATHEYLFIAKHYGPVFTWKPYFYCVALFLAGYLYAVSADLKFWMLVVLGTAPLAYLIAAMRARDLRDGLPAAAYSLFALLYIGVSLLTLVWVRRYADGVLWIVLLFAVVWTGDAAAMYSGKLVGRHKLAPRISPKKTWEGSVGSIVGSVLAAVIVLRFRDGILRASNPPAESWSIAGSGHGAAEVVLTPGMHHAAAAGNWMAPHSYVLAYILLAIVLNIAGQLGDLTESVLKRGAEVKDSGSLLPGHGGILDRIDALLFAAPVLWYYLVITRS